MGWRNSKSIELSSTGFPRVTSNEISWPFPDFFLTKSLFLLTFCSMKIWYFDLCRNSHGYAKKIAATIWQKNKDDLSFNVLCQLNHDIIYKISNIMEKHFPIFLHFLLVTVRLGNHIMTLTVKIWNEAFILIWTPFFLTFSWLFGEFQNFLTHIKISWLFLDFLRF